MHSRFRTVLKILGRLTLALVLVLVLGFLLRKTFLPSLGGVVEGARAEKAAAQANYRDGIFLNEVPIAESMSAVYKAITAPPVPAQRPDSPLQFSAEPLPPNNAPLAVTWLGHSTVVLELEGLRILIDPMFGRSAFPVEGMGPARYLEPPLSLESLGPIDVVLLSHDHYDHLDMATVQTLGTQGLPFVVPLGLGAHLEAWGIPAKQVTELGWWEEHAIQDVRFVSTPARHFSGRDLVGRFSTLWCGWALVGPSHRVYFSGDSGYGPHFAEIGRRLGPFELTMQEIGSYSPSWPDVHLGPEQALMAHRDVGGQVLLPVHWATFVMSNHGWTEPGERILAAAEPGDGLLLPRPGQRLVLAGEPVAAAEPLPTTRWWPDAPWRTAAAFPIRSNLPVVSQ